MPVPMCTLPDIFEGDIFTATPPSKGRRRNASTKLFKKRHSGGMGPSGVWRTTRRTFATSFAAWRTSFSFVTTQTFFSRENGFDGKGPGKTGNGCLVKMCEDLGVEDILFQKDSPPPPPPPPRPSLSIILFCRPSNFSPVSTDFCILKEVSTQQ